MSWEEAEARLGLGLSSACRTGGSRFPQGRGQIEQDTQSIVRICVPLFASQGWRAAWTEDLPVLVESGVYAERLKKLFPGGGLWAPRSLLLVCRRVRCEGLSAPLGSPVRIDDQRKGR